MTRTIRICQISGLERYRGSLKGEKSTHFVSEGGHREARIRALAAPEPSVLTDPLKQVTQPAIRTRDGICQISGLERYRGSLKGEKPTHFVSEGGHHEARIRALAAPEP